MNPGGAHSHWEAVRNRRKPPSTPPVRFVPFEGDGFVADLQPHDAGSLILEATNAEGETAPWFQDYWWTELVQHFAETALTIHFAPSPQAVLHPEVRHQVEMVRRVAPAWRMIGHAYRSDFLSAEDMRTVALSGFDEIRVIDADRPNWTPGRMRECATAAEVLGAIRREQQQLGTNRPTLVRAPAESAEHLRQFNQPAFPSEARSVPLAANTAAGSDRFPEERSTGGTVDVAEQTTTGPADLTIAP